MTTLNANRYFYAKELETSSLLYKQCEDKIYSLLAGKKINTALIAESIGMPRQTAYYKQKTRSFSSEELQKMARKAVEIYKLV